MHDHIDLRWLIIFHFDFVYKKNQGTVRDAEGIALAKPVKGAGVLPFSPLYGGIAS